MLIKDGKRFCRMLDGIKVKYPLSSDNASITPNNPIFKRLRLLKGEAFSWITYGFTTHLT